MLYEGLRFSGSANSWIASYLAGCSYQVMWRGSVSVPHALTAGVSQGSVLGPLLFSIYTKSLRSVITAMRITLNYSSPPPLLTQRWRHLSLRAWKTSQLVCRPTILSSTLSKQSCSSHSKTSPSRFTTPRCPPPRVQ